MRFDTASLDATRCARLITATIVPRPIAWIVTQTAAGARNAAPFSFFNALCSWPPILGVGMQPRTGGAAKDTLANIRETGEFVVNLVSLTQAAAMNLSSGSYSPEIDEISLCGLEVATSGLVAPPRISGSPVAFECKLRQCVEIDHGRVIVLGDVLSIHVEDSALIEVESGKVDARRLNLVARMHGTDQYLRTTDIFALERIAQPDHQDKSNA